MTKYKPMVLISPFSIAIIEIRKLENRRIVPIKIAVDVFIYFILCTTVLYMARSVQIMKIFSDEARAEFFNFSYYFFSIS